MTPATEADRAFLLRAIELGGRGWGRVHPNPMVGAVVVQGGEIVGEGCHAEYGGPHAEVVALEAAGPRARGAAVYVSLEPCAHHGKTPPCTDALIRAGVARVVFGARDPTAEAGGGADRLRAAGIQVDGGLAEPEVRLQNAAFFYNAERRATFVALKLATSLDAKLAAAPGTRTQVTGPEAMAEVQRLRAGFDAIMVGVETALVDDPLLSARGTIRPRRPPVRIVLDSRLRLPPRARSLQEGEGPLLIFCAEDAPAQAAAALEHAGATVLRVRASPQGVDLDAVLGTSWDRGIRSVLCEGGGRLASSLLRGGYARRLYLFLAPRLFGAGAVPAFPGDWNPAATRGWRTVEARAVGTDALIVFERED